jgi:hypothetical protein
LPLPAPASSSRGPSVVRTPRRCSGFSFAKSRAMHARRAAQKREEKSLMRSTCFLKILLDSTASPLPGQPFFPEFCKEIKNLFYFLLTSTFVRFIMRLEQEFQNDSEGMNMAASTTIFVLLGITAVTANLMKVITYLDQPRRKTRRVRARG